MYNGGLNMSYKHKIKKEIERLKTQNETYLDYKYAESIKWYKHGAYDICSQLLNFIDSLPEEFDCECDLIAKSENNNFEEIDRYCTLCMDINCFGCPYHDIHFRMQDEIKN